MKSFNNLKKDKDLQNKILVKVGSMPWLINALATIVNIGARCIAPVYMLGSLLTLNYKSKTIFLTKNNRDNLISKLNNYMLLMQNKTDTNGFIEWENCDSLLFTGLVGAVGHNVRIESAMDGHGMWHRRPYTEYSECYETGGAASTISRDMLLGLLWFIWRNKRLDLAEQLWYYGSRNKWIMGEGDVSRIYFTPGLQATLAQIIYRLGGSKRRIACSMPQVWPTELEGYEAHLEVLHILLLGEINGQITPGMEEALYDISARHPKNYLCAIALARYSDKQQTADDIGARVVNGLMDSRLWPDAALPSDADRSSRWLFENNDFSQGVDPTAFHTGGDFIFCAALMIGYSNELND